MDRRGGPGGSGYPVGLGRMTHPWYARYRLLDAPYSAATLNVAEPQVPKAPAAPEADLPPIHPVPVSPLSTVRIFMAERGLPRAAPNPDTLGSPILLPCPSLPFPSLPGFVRDRFVRARSFL